MSSTTLPPFYIPRRKSSISTLSHSPLSSLEINTAGSAVNATLMSPNTAVMNEFIEELISSYDREETEYYELLEKKKENNQYI